jgi:uncharacterized alkaline shock family protein YloU
MKIYALVGKSGTGKSYKALSVSYKYNIDLVIDDGLLINRNKLLGGKSAKKENTTIGAVKRAIFHHREHRNEIINEINLKEYNAILILATSNRMAQRIADNLELGNIDEYIYINDISTAEELKLAYVNRNEKGKHIIPLPTLELKKHFSGYLLDRVKEILKHEVDKNDLVGEKTVTRPTFSFYGKFTISDNTIIEIMRIATKCNEDVIFRKANIIKKDESIKIVVYVDVSYGVDIKNEILKFQKIIIDNIYKMTLINVIKCDVIIKDLKI